MTYIFNRDIETINPAKMEKDTQSSGEISSAL